MTAIQAGRIFYSRALHVGSFRDDNSPINGYLYLIFNDTWSWSDNKGSVEVTLTLF